MKKLLCLIVLILIAVGANDSAYAIWSGSKSVDVEIYSPGNDSDNDTGTVFAYEYRIYVSTFVFGEFEDDWWGDAWAGADAGNLSISACADFPNGPFSDSDTDYYYTNNKPSNVSYELDVAVHMYGSPECEALLGAIAWLRWNE